MFNRLLNKIIETDTIILVVLFGFTSIIPLFYLGFPFWVNFILFILLDFPVIGQIIGLVLWIWGLCSNLTYPQDIFSYLYYIAFAVIFVPVILAVIVKLMNLLINKIKISEKINKKLECKEFPEQQKKENEIKCGSIDKLDNSTVSKTTIDTSSETEHNDVDTDVLKIHNMNLKKFIELINNHFKQFSLSKEQKINILQECFNLYLSKILSLDLFNEELKVLQSNLLLGFLKPPFSSFNKTLLKNIDENKSYDGTKQYKVKFLSEESFNVLYHTIFRLFNVTEYCKFIDSKNYISYMSNEIFYIVTTKSTNNTKFPLNYDNFPSEKATAIITFCATCWDYTDNFIKIFVEEYYAEYYNK